MNKKYPQVSFVNFRATSPLLKQQVFSELHIGLKIVLLLFPLFYFSACAEQQKDRDDNSQLKQLPPIEVIVEELDSSDFYMELVSNGKLEGLNKSEMRFRLNEKISKVYVKNGQWVTKGQVLARLEDYELKNKKLQAKVSMENARISLTDYLIGQGFELQDSTGIPKETFAIAKIKSGYQSALTNYELAQFNVRQATLRASSNGAIANLTVKENNYSSNQSPFCLIIDNSSLEIKFPIMEPEMNLVENGQKVKIMPYYMTKEIVGVVTSINPLISENGLIQVTALIPRPSYKLYEGMNAKIFVNKKIGKSLSVPKSAIVLRSERPVVFKYEEGKAKWIYVKTAEENHDRIVITEGLKVGDQVIVNGNLHLAHESNVVVK